MENMVKLSLTAYKTQDFSARTSGVSPFIVPVNPDTLSRSFATQQNNTSATGNAENDGKFERMASQQLSFDFILDGTGIIEGYDKSHAKKDVSVQIEHFLNVTYKMNGDIRQPNFIKVVWGQNFTFDCKLESLSISYTLFKPNGEPLRAKLNVSFKGFVNPKKRVEYNEQKNNGDLTKIIEAADNLANVADSVYNDASKYLQIAKANGIVNFRGIKEGVELILPPIQKASQAVSEAANKVGDTAKSAQNALNRFF
jgi:Contractile injection system tube protein